MSRDSEKVLKELQKFLDAHAEDTENEADVDALAERFFAEYNLKCKEQKESAPETADDYLDLAEQVTSKKKRVEYLHKALELEPDNLDARLQLILRTAEQPDERRLPCRSCSTQRTSRWKSPARSRSTPVSFGQRLKPDHICACAIHTLTF